MVLRRFDLSQDRGIPNPTCEAADIQPIINRALHQGEAPAAICVGNFHRNCWGFVIGITNPTRTVIKAARTLNLNVVDLDLEANRIWKRAGIYGVLVFRYLGKGAF